MMTPTDPRLRAIGTALRSKRTELHLTVRQLAAELHVAPSTISRIENVANSTDLRVLLRVLDWLGLTGAFLGPSLKPAAAYNRGWEDCANAMRATLGSIAVPADTEGTTP